MKDREKRRRLIAEVIARTAPEVLGIDIGSTIVDRSKQPRQAFPDALRVIKRLVDERFGRERTFIVSKVNDDQKARAQKWLRESRFHELTGIPENHVEFCAERCDKAPICQRLSITHFIDDRPDVLYHMLGIVKHRFQFQGIEGDIEMYRSLNGNVVRVMNWKEVEGLLL